MENKVAKLARDELQNMEILYKKSRTQNFELPESTEFMPRVYDVKLPCQWLTNCDSGRCPAFIRKNGNFYCARKTLH